jgi:hypothetical protein
VIFDGLLKATTALRRAEKSALHKRRQLIRDCRRDIRRGIRTVSGSGNTSLRVRDYRLKEIGVADAVMGELKRKGYRMDFSVRKVAAVMGVIWESPQLDIHWGGVGCGELTSTAYPQLENRP